MPSTPGGADREPKGALSDVPALRGSDSFADELTAPGAGDATVAEALPPELLAAQLAAQGRSGLLLIDPDGQSRRGLKSLLEDEEVRVMEVPDPSEASGIAARMGLPVAVIAASFDILEGAGLVRSLLSGAGGVRVLSLVLLDREARAEDANIYYAAGAVWVVRRPVEAQALGRHVRDVTRGRRPPPARFTPCALPTQVDAREEAGEIFELSINGGRIRGLPGIPVTRNLRLRFALPGGAIDTWVRAEGFQPGDGGQARFQFLDLDDDTQAAVALFVEQQLAGPNGDPLVPTAAEVVRLTFRHGTSLRYLRKLDAAIQRGVAGGPAAAAVAAGELTAIRPEEEKTGLWARSLADWELEAFTPELAAAPPPAGPARSVIRAFVVLRCWIEDLAQAVLREGDTAVHDAAKPIASALSTVEDVLEAARPVTAKLAEAREVAVGRSAGESARVLTDAALVLRRAWGRVSPHVAGQYLTWAAPVEEDGEYSQVELTAQLAEGHAARLELAARRRNLNLAFGGIVGALVLGLFATANLTGWGEGEQGLSPLHFFGHLRRFALGVGAFGLLLVLHRIAGRSIKTRSFLRFSPREVALAAGAGLLIGALGPRGAVNGPIAGALIVALLHVATETFFFRVAVTNAALRMCPTQTAALALTVSVYTLYQLSWHSLWSGFSMGWTLYYALLLGVAAGVPYTWLYLRSRSLWPPFIAQLGAWMVFVLRAQTL